MNRKLLSLAGALALTCAASAQTTTNVISETTFDSAAGSPWAYGYFYGDNGAGTFVNPVERSYYFPEDTDQTNAVYKYTFDTSALTGATGWGTGTGAPLFRADTDPALFTSGDRADYILSFDTRAAGLAEGQTSANGEMQFQFYRRNETGQESNLLQVNVPFQPTAEWKTVRIPLDQGFLGAGTLDADFEKFRSEIFDLRFNVNFHEPFAFGNDAENSLFLDNVKLEVINRPTSGTPTPTFTKPIADWNMDDKPVWWEFTFNWSANENRPIFDGDNNANNSNPNTQGVDGSSAWFVSMDNTSFAENTPAWAGGGSVGAGPTDYTLFDTPDMSAYRVTFDARVAGLAEGRENTAAILQLHVDVADDTLAQDEDTNREFLGRYDFQVGRLTAEYQNYSFLLSRAGATAEAKANFANFFNKIAEVRTQWQIENATSATDWGFDADNVFYIDNIKIERVYQGLAPLAFSTEDNELVLTWSTAATGTTRLQSATSVDGPYTNVTTEGTTYRAPVTGPQRYFRLAWDAPTAE